MFELSREKNPPFPSTTISMNVLYRNKEVYPQSNESFQCIDIYNRKASVALWVLPLTHKFLHCNGNQALDKWQNMTANDARWLNVYLYLAETHLNKSH